MNSKRITSSQKEQEFHIEINPYRNTGKSKLLLIWLVIWTFCGMIVFSQFFSNMSKEEKLYMAIWMAFWGYFEYAISKVYVWRKSGMEKIIFKGEQMIHQIVNGKQKQEHSYFFESMIDLASHEFGENQLTDSMQSSYWVKGNECIFFNYMGSKKGLGFQLNKEEANQLLSLLVKEIKRRKQA